MMKNFKMTYDEVADYCNDLSDKLVVYNPTLIVGIARGGLIPAVHLSHALNLPMETLLWQTRDGSNQEHNPAVAKAIADGEVVVFVDDINDSGKTFTDIKEHYNAGITACILEKMQSKFVCDVVGGRTDSERWIEFPWEPKEIKEQDDE